MLLNALTKANAEIQKIVAFENAFERLLTIIDEEGFSDGGIIVADCLSLLLNLLRGNASNQVRRARPPRVVVVGGGGGAGAGTNPRTPKGTA